MQNHRMAETDVVVRITQSIIRIPIGKTGIGTIIPIATDQRREPTNGTTHNKSLYFNF